MPIIVLLLTAWCVTAQSPVVYLNALRSDKIGVGDYDRLYRDHRGYFWSSAKNSLCLLEGKTFKKYVFAPKEESEYVNSDLHGMPNGDIWFTTAKGLYQYSYQTDSVYRVRNDQYILLQRKEASSALMFDVNTATVFQTDSMWRQARNLGKTTGQNFRLITNQNGALEWLFSWKMNTKQNQGLIIKRYYNQQTPTTSTLFDKKLGAFPLLNINDVFVEHEQKIWIAATEGLYVYNPSVAQAPVQYFPGLKDVKGIVKRKNGDYWMFTAAQGLLTFRDEPGSGCLAVRTNDYAGLTPSRMCRMYLDEYEVLWMAFSGEGIGYTALPNSRFLIIDTEKILETSGATITTVVEDAHRNVLIGTQSAGLLEWDRKTDNISTQDLPGFDKKGRIFHLFNDAQKNTWVVTRNRVFRRKSSEPLFKPITLTGESLKNINLKTYHLTEHHDGRLILSCDSVLVEMKPTGEANILVNSICQTGIVTNAFAHKTGGLFLNNDYNNVLFVPSDGTPCMSIDAPYAEAICSDSQADSLVWIGCSKGLLCFHVPSRQIIQPYTSLSGVLPPLYNITNLYSASDGRLWATTNQSLHVLDFQHGNTSSYSTNYGLIGDAFFKNTLFETTLNEIVVANSKVLYLLKPNQMSETQVPLPHIYLKNILIDYKPYGQPENLQLTQYLELSYGQAISFEFLGIDYLMSDSLALQCRMDGLDAENQWVDFNNGSVGFSRYAKLKGGDYVFRARVKGATDEHTIQLHIHPPWYETWLFYLISLAGMLAFIYGIIKYRERQIRKEAMLIQEKHTAELNALRAFINPHFLFNALNSINAFILTGRTDKANEYLGDFSRLMRLMLDHAQKSLVSLDEELNLIESYVFIEKRRFKYPFDYQVKIAEELDVNQVLIPSMILQPYVENAIWHGLQHLQQPGGHIMIAVRKQDDFIEILIEDNGVGRVKAAEIKNRQVGGRHKSQGLHLTRLRIEKTATDNTVNTIDLYDAAGNAAGTRVIIRLKEVE
ncbi:MAG: histidine kinase [Saprospiraceae bacterium]|nr:histidine kinase [Saprospiraceae bacterium]